MGSSNATLKGSKRGLPGHLLPVNHVPKKGDADYVGDLFPSALNAADILSARCSLRMTTLREFGMMGFVNSITDKPDWHIKVNDEKIAEKWKEEVLAAQSDLFSEAMADWCIGEARHYAKNPINPIFVYNGDVFKSDIAVSPEFKQSLQAAVSDFEAKISEKQKDWHPGSDGKVLDLVHPSLYPLVYGKSRILEDGQTTTLEDCIDRCGEGVVSTVPSSQDLFPEINRSQISDSFSAETNDTPYSAKFQWLPCEVDISGGECRITSYINNLHPTKEKALYTSMERLIDASIPLWNETLAPLAHKSFKRPHRISFDSPEYDPDPGSWEDDDERFPPQRDGEDEDDYWDRKQEFIQDTRIIVQPEPKLPFTPLARPKPFDLKEKYAASGLQVIVKLANIELTPEKPEYGGGSWHVEGQLNEHIVATSLYYYSCENITTSSLSFRQHCDPEETIDIAYEQNDHGWIEPVFGCTAEGPTVQDVGSIVTREGRLITFPNVLQHCVQPFKLADPTKPGHRKIVALFLVDPNIKIISTANVPCQQQEWWWERAMASKTAEAQLAKFSRRSAVKEIPLELQDNILEGVDFPISLEEAKKLRLELMEERKNFVISSGKAFASASFSLCEH